MGKYLFILFARVELEVDDAKGTAGKINNDKRSHANVRRRWKGN
jgi:hypothetical protein